MGEHTVDERRVTHVKALGPADHRTLTERSHRSGTARRADPEVLYRCRQTQTQGIENVQPRPVDHSGGNIAKA
jgi:hypothetical protein